MRRTLLAAVACTAGLLQLACTDSVSGNLFTRLNLAQGSLTMSDLESACTGSDGRWSSMLFSCICPKNEVFFVNTSNLEKSSCRTLMPDADACNGQLSLLDDSQFEICGLNFYSNAAADVQIVLRDLTNAQRARLLKLSTKNTAAMLRGISLPDADVSTPIRIKLAHPSRAADISIWHDREQYPVNSAAYLGEVLLPLGSAKSSVSSCREVVKNKRLDSQFDVMCELAFNVIERAGTSDTSSNSGGVDMNLAEMHDGCDPFCTFVADGVLDDLKVLYRVRMVEGIPFQRSIRVTDGQGHRYTALLSPLGHIEGHRFEQDQQLLQEDQLLERRDIFAGHDGRIIEDREVTLGSYHQLDAALSSVISAPLPTDSGGLLHGAFKALMIDSGIDVRLDGLAPRLSLSSTQLPAMDPFNKPVLSYMRTPVQHLLDVLDNPNEGAAGHGTEMASLILQDLPDAKLALLRADDVEGPMLTASIGERWRDFIRTSGAHVVNVSWVFEQDVASCEALFGPMLDELPNVLFVFGAGNWSVSSPISACPASLARRYHNAITVAGSEGTGARVTISRSSAYGSDFANVAAPYRSTCGYVKADGLSGTRPCSGTSVSAAIVSNAALKLLAINSELMPEEIISALMDTCDRQGLEVGCGGNINLAAALEKVRPWSR